MIDRKTLFLIRGVSGAGKSTFAQHLEFLYHGAERHIACFAADDWMVNEDYEYDWNPARLGYCHERCYNATRNSVEAGVPVIVHNTFTTEKELKPYIELAERHDYHVVSLIVENRHGSKSLHAVPDETLDKQAERFSVQLK